ncbi:energy transducer TonB [Aliarcobacter cibarius]|uniref:Energy transducer TonB n=2 Tax=Aliarcobacter cibarius TaxID=255507 RepID=A0A5J6RGF0_9BACT|nr:TonB family protein [Aliarcobacter cibarius]QEZ88965.1 TonB domain-containing protein [Aliarcobacter cibarius]QKJ27009.1 TonB domain-containing protein [Aliarcobacter cibarius]TLS98491.1 energy transducer TonB [Aliarcobacter cibarius]TLS99199.1 energy transducer TonB [Aliarcobacter cibarius]TLT03664.1 energy transducer TonB [Aliarcobacter cibarius]
MKKILLAILISLLLHLTFLFNYKSSDKNHSEEEKKVEKTDMKFVKLTEIKEQKVLIEKPKDTPLPEKKVEKIIEKPKEVKTPKTIDKPKNNPEKIVKKEIKEAKEFQNKVLKEQVVENKPTIQDKTLENFLNQKEPVNKEILTQLEKLYGKEYQNFTTVQKAYLEKNLNNFQVITQRVLNRMGYPKLAEKLRIGGVNIVEFMFHPDGSISGLKITSSSGYTILDDYSLELIEIAYKDYPKPTEKTKIKFQIFYRMY